MARRRRAREVVLQLLYQEDLNPDVTEVNVERFLAGRLQGDRVTIEFARQLLQGVRRNLKELDQQLENHTENWELQRMAATDRNVLRLAAFELLYAETPGLVAINEAVDLARRYGSKQSAQFVNGVLDGLLPRDAAGQPLDSIPVDEIPVDES
ncbi:MAG: transcription antitermination factor NusB [Planctomycetota bacterium]|nr:transcription antitermination factor NusB [Planctomycetota bacterium]MDA1180502.1 transcription antitermination factor NusB [Planctomycetota bacterium]